MNYAFKFATCLQNFTRESMGMGGYGVGHITAEHHVALRENDVGTLKNLEARASPGPMGWAWVIPIYPIGMVEELEF